MKTLTELMEELEERGFYVDYRSDSIVVWGESTLSVPSYEDMREYNELESMFSAMYTFSKDNPDCECVSADDPVSRGFGFLFSNDDLEVYFHIGITDVKNSDMSSKFNTTGKRKTLAKIFSDVSQLKSWEEALN